MKFLITGGSNGMGKGVAKALAARDQGAHEVIVLCSSKERGETAVQDIVSSTGNQATSLVLCDLARLKDVRKAVQNLRDEYEVLDGVFINAGLGYASRRVETEDGMDSHFQVNYLAQFMLTLHLLDLLEKSATGGRVIFNVADFGKLYWDDLQMTKKWGYERGIGQAMVAKRMFYPRLHSLHSAAERPPVSFYGFRIHKTVWSNQLNLIPFPMKAMATVMKWFGQFITIDQCGELMAPLFTEDRETSLARTGKMVTYEKGDFVEMQEDAFALDTENQSRLWDLSVELCQDQAMTRLTTELA